ncbi:MAG: ATP-dependent zinc metalloprotease FtsH [Actinobacteria bacterium]|nr:ATP-dependent zinc metalloprotease FtsH [Actinomycetota bacterium]
MSRQPQDMRRGRFGPQGPPQGPQGGVPGRRPDQSWMWVIGLIVLLVLAFAVVPGLVSNHTKRTELGFSKFSSDVSAKQVKTAVVDNTTGVITGQLRNGVNYTVNGPNPVDNSFDKTMLKDGVVVNYVTTGQSLWPTIIQGLIFVLLFVGIFVWFYRRSQGQMSSVMSIGKSKARLYSTERPKTTFADVAGYPGVKQEIKEVVDFLKYPSRFKEIGARIPRGILLVGPPGTGKTLLARAVAGEAGVPFMSVTGSDFMEMFVGVGASRVRDMFQTARKEAPAIVFVDEVDSIGRKRGAGIGGGHDEREQTLNQMLSEMDGFDATEGIVMMAATNRPDILDPALLRPGRFDRQIVVPLPDLDERLPILQVHCQDKRVDDDVDLALIARGTPGMSGADLANLVNEAALHAVRRGANAIAMEDFDAARDRVLMGQRREGTVLSDEEKERVAYHEGGHAVLAYVLENADPVHKVTILPSGMALGVTQQLPLEGRHIHSKEGIEEAIVVRMGGRVAEMLVYGDLSTGASNDLVGNTELARKMVREWGMSERIGPMAWGSQGMVFLGEDLMHSRDYSENMSGIIDEEVDRILREQEARAFDLLSKHREGLNAVAAALLEKETISGADVARLVDEAYGRPVHENGKRSAVAQLDGAIDALDAPATLNGSSEDISVGQGNGSSHTSDSPEGPEDGPVATAGSQPGSTRPAPGHSS